MQARGEILWANSRGEVEDLGGLQIEGSFVVYVSHKIEAPPCLARLRYLRLEKTRSEQRSCTMEDFLSRRG